MAVRPQHRNTTSDVEPAPSQDIGDGLPQNGNHNLFIHKLKPIRRNSSSWEWMIVEQFEGQSISQVAETLYLYELRIGASLVDIGIWKSLFDRTVAETVYQLVHNGYISLVPDAKKMEGRRASSGKE